MFIQDDKDDHQVLPPPRSGHVGCALIDSIFIWGGYTDEYRRRDGMDEFHQTLYMDPSAIWFYYPAEEKWQRLTVGFNHPSPSSGAEAVFVPSKSSVYLLFGFSGQIRKNSVYVFDLRTQGWRCVNYGSLRHQEMPSPRDKFAAWEFEDKIYVFGGYGPSPDNYLNSYGNSVEDLSILSNFVTGWNNQLLEFDVNTETWKCIKCQGSIPSSRAAHAATRIGRKVYVFGGRHQESRLNDLYQLDLTTMTWTRSWHTLGGFNSTDKLILLGGYSDQNEVLDDVWTFDINTSTWTMFQAGKSWSKRLWHTTNVTSNDDVVTFGGCISDVYGSQPVHNNDLAVLRITPDNLFKLALSTIFKNRKIFENRICDLPAFCKQKVSQMWSCSDKLHIFV